MKRYCIIDFLHFLSSVKFDIYQSPIRLQYIKNRLNMCQYWHRFLAKVSTKITSKKVASEKVSTPFSLVCGINDGNRQLVPKYRIRGNNAFMSTPLSCRHLIYNLVVSVPSIVCYRSMASLFRNFFS